MLAVLSSAALLHALQEGFKRDGRVLPLAVEVGKDDVAVQVDRDAAKGVHLPPRNKLDVMGMSNACAYNYSFLLGGGGAQRRTDEGATHLPPLRALARAGQEEHAAALGKGLDQVPE